MPRGGRRLPDECLRRLRDADLVVHAGDFVARSVLADLEALGPPVVAVCGNMDDAELQRSLPTTRVVEAGQVRIGVIHAPGQRAGREARLAARFPDCDAVVYGHTHVPQIERFQHLWVLNPGSPTERRTAPVRSMIVLTIRGRRIMPELVNLP